MKVGEAMTRKVGRVSPRQSIAEAARLMAECDAGVLPVMEDERLVGIVTDRDIAIRAVGRELPPATPVADVMSAEVLHCFEDEDIELVAQSMGEQQVRRLPVLSRERRLVGMVSLGDLARMAEARRAAARAMADIAQRSGMHNQSHSLH